MPTLFCDLDGVLFADPAPRRRLEALRAANGGRLEIRTEAELWDEQAAGFEAGLVGEAEFALHLRARLGWTGSDEELARCWGESLGAVALDVLEVLGGLRERGWTLIGAVDGDPWVERARQRQAGWATSLFDRTVTSTAARARRPDPRFFAELARAGDRHGPRLYVDDLAQHVAAARRAGLDGHVFSDPVALGAACRDLVVATT